MFSMLLWRLTSFLSLSVSFLVWLECVFLGRLCWLYCGLLGSVFFFLFFFFASVCASSISLLPLDRLLWLYRGFRGLWVGFA